MPLYTWKVTWNYAYSPFKTLFTKTHNYGKGKVSLKYFFMSIASTIPFLIDPVCLWAHLKIVSGSCDLISSVPPFLEWQSDSQFSNL